MQRFICIGIIINAENTELYFYSLLTISNFSVIILMSRTRLES